MPQSLLLPHRVFPLTNLPSSAFFQRKVPGWRILEHWKACEGSLVFYESKYKIEKTLLLLSGHGHDRFVCLARELTKLHETILSGSLSYVLARFQNGSSKGEFTVVVAPLVILLKGNHEAGGFGSWFQYNQNSLSKPHLKIHSRFYLKKAYPREWN